MAVAGVYVEVAVAVAVAVGIGAGAYEELKVLEVGAGGREPG